ncbi:HIT zinc finger [Ophiocordyceps camponoti-floridani]|uniref:Box C/D snoRNA protein 1 n=1 Tax=Ophiocordyceps camponoti-floridani TaxID=2030778 RepID=A0A8H4Q3V2_9HYPO|nr:HIT zinc finger [Ophiocordyceps camponoti-floridani]
MADPLLTTLCSICHTAQPKYQCPRCLQRSCSLACVKKHKAWSSCNGERDEAAYVPASRLRTVAGLNHDYNYLHKIDLSMERAERLLVSEKGLVSRQELRPQTVQQVQWKTGRDGRRVKVVTTKAVRETVERSKSQRLLDGKMARLGVELVRAPRGMTRSKENNTSVGRRSGCVHWQVEWMVLGGEGESTSMTRALSKVFDYLPLYRAYHALLRDSPTRKIQKGGHVNGEGRPSDSAWSRFEPTTMQEPSTECWVPLRGTGADLAWPHDLDEAQRRRFRFFLGGPPSGSTAAVVVTAVAADGCLREVLRGTTVVEFPTVYVMGAGERLPASFVVRPGRGWRGWGG